MKTGPAFSDNAQMPEMPEVQAIAEQIDARFEAATVASAQLGSLSALKTYDPPLSALEGAALTRADRQGKYLLMHFVDPDGVVLDLVVHFSRSGWLHWDSGSAGRLRPGKGPVALRLTWSDGSVMDITEAGTHKRLALHLVPDASVVTAGLGPDPLTLSAEEFSALLRGGRQLKTLLRDQSVISGIGNAYSDEILHRARLSPYAKAGSLDAEQSAALYVAVRDVLAEATERARKASPGQHKTEKKQGLQVHGRTGEPCPVCGSTIARIRLSDSEFQYCPGCQTDGVLLSDPRMSKLLK